MAFYSIGVNGESKSFGSVDEAINFLKNNATNVTALGVKDNNFGEEGAKILAPLLTEKR
ncbi:MAG: hypothetical protein PG981_000153 [Wolbachia endosymbiont of Ctenocephalides orientis wCori]|nr:MAG: hypothetical protein PG981_000153 [Wolbachia endosymbiont of Ctenocephalides orientis wCori]